MLTDDILNGITLSTGMAFDSLRELPIDQATWHYQWARDKVHLLDPENTVITVPSWEVLEITKAEYDEWSQEPGGLIVTAKDVSDYVKEVVLKKSANRKVAAGIS